MDKYDSYYKLGYTDALVWRLGPHDRKGVEEGFEDSYADGYADGALKARAEEEDARFA